MVKCKAVIGANFGDEGKGKITNYYADDKSIVVRYNAGAQSSHTVEHEGRRHAFRHFGAGTFKNAATFLSEYFITNPILFKTELTKLRNMGYEPKLFISPDALVTTPFDMLINQMLEDQRSTNKHGSCGLGINETLIRNDHYEYELTVRDLLEFDKDTIIGHLYNIKNEYLPERLAELKINIPDKYLNIINNPNLIEHYISDALDMITYGDSLSKGLIGCEQIIFEGGQGLLLDKNNTAYFPHLTPTNTGLRNILDLAMLDINQELEVTYVTRCYCTRHGAGYLPHEQENLPEFNIIDETNIPNQYQGTLRFGYLDLDILFESIQKDLDLAKKVKYKITPKIAVNCLDQLIGDTIPYYCEGNLQRSNIDTFLHKIAKSFPILTV